jgi:hypothetical protein
LSADDGEEQSPSPDMMSTSSPRCDGDFPLALGNGNSCYDEEHMSRHDTNKNVAFLFFLLNQLIITICMSEKQ